MSFDKDLLFLNELTNEELEVLVKIILDKGSLTETLSVSDLYKKFKPNHKMYIEKIVQELSEFGGNSFVNLFRGGGVEYKEILKDVCDKINIKTSTGTVGEMENRLLSNVLEKAWQNMTASERQVILDEMGQGDIRIEGMAGATFVALFNAGGFASYKLSLIIANVIAKTILGTGLSFAANAALTRALSVVAGPIGIIISGLWALKDISGPAYRVTVPATIYIAAMRHVYNNK